jgi:hypothetical protein
MQLVPLHQGCVATLLAAPAPAPAPRYETANDTTVTVTKAQAKAIIMGWEKNWLEAVPARMAKYTHVDVAYIAGRSLEDTIKDASKVGPCTS